MHWRAELDDLKRRASAQTMSCASREALLESLRGHLPQDRVTADHLRRFSEAARALGVDPSPCSVITHGWRVALSRDETPDQRHRWHLSASLSPPGRSSTIQDWKRLGHFAAHLGAPKDPLIAPDDPTRPVHWSWIEEA